MLSMTSDLQALVCSLLLSFLFHGSLPSFRRGYFLSQNFWRHPLKKVKMSAKTFDVCCFQLDRFSRVWSFLVSPSPKKFAMSWGHAELRLRLKSWMNNFYVQSLLDNGMTHSIRLHEIICDILGWLITQKFVEK